MRQGVLLLLCCGTAAAADVGIHVPSAPLECLAAARLVATSDPAGQTVTAPLAPSARSGSLSLTGDAVWRIRLDAPHCWSSSALWAAGSAGDVMLDVYRAGSVDGTLQIGRGTAPQRFQVKLFRAQGSESARTAASGDGDDLSCVLEFPRWSCLVPGGVPFDLRLEAPGFAAVYYWNVVAAANRRTSVGASVLTPGASVTGSVQNPSGMPLKTKVVLFPLQESRSRGLAAIERSQETNGKGFFQFTGLDPGEYRIVSYAAGYSPMVVSPVSVRNEQTVVLPRPITHVPFAKLTIALDPPTAAGGMPWVIALAEGTRISPAISPPPLGQPAGKDGRWSANHLRADVYRLQVLDRGGAVLDERFIDLSDGESHALDISIAGIRRHGMIRAGDAPLEADVEFSDPVGRRVTAHASEGGTFDIVFPSPGQWTPVVRFPRGRNAARISVKSITVLTEKPDDIDILLPGGRVRGVVTSAGGDPSPAVVHLMRSGRLVAQQRTSDDGRFDLIGLSSGDYALDAEGADGTTPQPVPATVDDHSASDFTLVIQPYRRVHGIVLTPAGTPASGALVRVSVDNGLSWSRTVADVDGQFSYKAPGRTDAVDLIALTFAYPALLMHAGAGEPIVMQLAQDGGVLRIRGLQRAFIRAQDAAAPVQAFLYPEPFGRFSGGIFLQPGSYTVCPDPVAAPACQSATVGAGGEVTLEFGNGKGSR
jgi:hypothetical protein